MSNFHGPLTFHAQQQHLLSQSGNHQTTLDAFITNLTTTHSSFHQQGHQLILGGNFNDNLTSPTSIFAPILQKFNLVDLYQKCSGDIESSTYSRGCQRLDYILVSASLLSSISATGMLPYDLIILSNHQGLYINLRTSIAFG